MTRQFWNAHQNHIITTFGIHDSDSTTPSTSIDPVPKYQISKCSHRPLPVLHPGWFCTIDAKMEYRCKLQNDMAGTCVCVCVCFLSSVSFYLYISVGLSCQLVKFSTYRGSTNECLSHSFGNFPLARCFRKAMP